MRTLFACCILLLCGRTAFCQNLLANGGFEEENICTEYKENCAPEAWIATSLFANYYFDASRERAVKAHEGTHYVGLTAGNLYKPGERNFVRGRLLCGLQAGHQYKLEMWLYAPQNILDSIGVYFSDQDFLLEKRSFIQINPQLWSKDGMGTNSDEGFWKRVAWLYTANGTEGFIAIGNFKRNDYSGIRFTEYRNDYYFFLDGVSLTPVDPKEKFCFQMDSVKNEIYSENERHNYLVRKVYQNRKTPPPVRPLPKTAERIQHIDTLIIPDIFFATASYQLSPVSFHVLDSFASRLSLPAIDSMVVSGHTDSIGKLAYNETLSLNRAVAVKDYLNSKVEGLQEKTTTRGFAYLLPVASNKTPAGRKLNRRVEIILYREE